MTYEYLSNKVARLYKLFNRAESEELKYDLGIPLAIGVLFALVFGQQHGLERHLKLKILQIE